jgi:uncharacterized protein (DUF2267 family)
MTTTSLGVFDRTIEKTNHWLREIMEELGWESRHAAYVALRSTLHALRDMLTVPEAAQLAAQLPVLIRGFYYEGWKPTAAPQRPRHRAEFLARMEAEFRTELHADTDEIARAVFGVLARHVTDGEISDVKRQLPADVRALWPD